MRVVIIFIIILFYHDYLITIATITGVTLAISIAIGAMRDNWACSGSDGKPV